MRIGSQFWTQTARLLLMGSALCAAPLIAADEPLTIMGVSIGMDAAAAQDALSARTDQGITLRGDDDTRRRALDAAQATNTAAPLYYDIDGRGTLSLEFTQSVQKPQVQSIDYQIEQDPDVAARIERQIRRQFGAPMSVYTLGGEQRLMVWDIAAPEQSRDFGPLISIALTTYDEAQSPQARLMLSQFSKPLPGQIGSAASKLGASAPSTAPPQTSLSPSRRAPRSLGPSD